MTLAQRQSRRTSGLEPEVMTCCTLRLRYRKSRGSFGHQPLYNLQTSSLRHRKNRRPSNNASVFLRRPIPPHLLYIGPYIEPSPLQESIIIEYHIGFYAILQTSSLDHRENRRPSNAAMTLSEASALRAPTHKNITRGDLYE